MEEELMGIKNAAVSLILDARDAVELEELKLQFLGKSGKLTMALKELGKLPKQKRPEVGQLANDVKRVVEETIATAEYNLKAHQKSENVRKNKNFQQDKTSVASSEHLDVTNPGITPALGHLHPITQAVQEITAIFEKIGFTRVRYPEVEWDYYSFSALNFPEHHPARDDWETFFMKEQKHPKNGQMILTPHTSSGQVREMSRVAGSGSAREKGEINIRMLNIAKCYRRQSDVSHTAMFHQFETLVVGKEISISHLKGVLDFFVKSYFGPNRKSRIRPYHFQFTEPSFETDVSCGVCDGTGCKLCKEGWLELGGAGMVHPNVLKAGGIDPTVYTGFASGWGVERVLMMKEGLEIDDLRLLYSNKLEFLEQF